MICLPRGSTSSPSQNGDVVSAVSVIRVLANSRNRLLVSATDGHLYILKLYDQQSRLREALGTELASAIGLKVPAWRPIWLSKDFIHEHILIWDKLPAEGYYFGSRQVGISPGEMAVDVLPGNWQAKIENRGDFVGSLLFDYWTNSKSPRQAIYFRRSSSEGFTAMFIGFRYVLGIHNDHTRENIDRRHADKRLYDGQWNELVFNDWQRRICSMEKQTLQKILVQLPLEWMKTVEPNQIIAQLLGRKKWIEKFTFAPLETYAAWWLRVEDETSLGFKDRIVRRFTAFAVGI